jgi:hypothetical protein
VEMKAKMDDERNVPKEGSAHLFEPNPAGIPMKEVGPIEYETPLFEDEQ